MMSKGFPTGLVVKNSHAKPESWVQSLGWEDALEEVMATYSSILPWVIPWAGSLAGYSHGVGNSQT